MFIMLIVYNDVFVVVGRDSVWFDIFIIIV